AGTTVTLSYTTAGSTVEIAQQTTTDGAGNYQFVNLLEGKYRVRARHTGFILGQPADVNLTATATLDIPVVLAGSYTPSTPPVIPLGGGESEFTITTNDPTCEWNATRDPGSPWIVI